MNIMPPRNGLPSDRAAIRAEMAEIVSVVGADGRNVKETLALAAERLRLSERRVRAFHQQAADPWAWEADRLRRLERDFRRRRLARLEHEAEIERARLAAHATEDA